MDTQEQAPPNMQPQKGVLTTLRFYCAKCQEELLADLPACSPSICLVYHCKNCAEIVSNERIDELEADVDNRNEELALIHKEKAALQDRVDDLENVVKDLELLRNNAINTLQRTI